MKPLHTGGFIHQHYPRPHTKTKHVHVLIQEESTVFVIGLVARMIRWVLMHRQNVIFPLDVHLSYLLRPFQHPGPPTLEALGAVNQFAQCSPHFPQSSALRARQEKLRTILPR